MHRLGLAAQWREWPQIARRAVVASVIVALIVAGIATNALRRTSDLYVVVAAALVLLLGRSANTGFWVGLERAGVGDARGRWGRRSPILQRALPPLLIGGFVLLAVWAAGVAPDP